VIKDSKPNNLPEFVCIKVFRSQLEANLARGLLKANKVESMVSTDSIGGMRPDLELTRGVRLLVRRKDAEEAADILGPTDQHS